MTGAAAWEVGCAGAGCAALVGAGCSSEDGGGAFCTGAEVAGSGSGVGAVVDAGSLPMKPSGASVLGAGAGSWLVGVLLVSAGGVVVGDGWAC